VIDADDAEAASAPEEHKEAEQSESTAGSHAFFTPARKKQVVGAGVLPSPSSAHKRNGSSPAYASHRGVQAKSASSSRKKLNHRA
jgi:hypothetical protein